MEKQQPIIQLSTAAIAHVKKMMMREEGNKGLRISVKKRGCTGYSYVLELIKEQTKITDQKIEQDDVLIFVDEDAIAYINGTIVDYVNKGFGLEEWLFKNPNAESLCGCGESFNVRSEEVTSG